MLRYSHRADETFKSTTKVTPMLCELRRQGLLKVAKWADIQVPHNFKEKFCVRNTLELIDVVISSEERASFQDKDADESTIMGDGKSIETKCLLKLLEYEKKDPGVEKQIKKKRPSHQHLPTYGAIGSPVKN